MSVIVSGVSKLYGKQKALNNVSFQISKGEVVGFLGPNGAGKSTMMKILTCYIPSTEGTASVEGFDTVANSIEVRKHVGYLPEHNPLYLDMYVKEYLTFVAGTYGVTQNVITRVNEMISLTGLGPEQTKKIGALSKGYRQRVGLAQAIIHNPDVLILDEPTSGLDPNQLVDIRQLIKELGKSKTVILSTHIMQEVEAICSRVIIVNKGQIVADDSTQHLQQKSAGNNVIIVEFGTKPDVQALQQLPQITNVQHVIENTYKITSNGTDDIRKNIFDFAVQTNNSVLSMVKDESSLEQIFQKLTTPAK
nr:gliding motility-associated ABC transporter ATP-binding subunit GldA [Bacteroidota bacterium]